MTKIKKNFFVLLADARRAKTKAVNRSTAIKNKALNRNNRGNKWQLKQLSLQTLTSPR